MVAEYKKMQIFNIMFLFLVCFVLLLQTSGFIKMTGDLSDVNYYFVEVDVAIFAMTIICA